MIDVQVYSIPLSLLICSTVFLYHHQTSLSICNDVQNGSTWHYWNENCAMISERNLAGCKALYSTHWTAIFYNCSRTWSSRSSLIKRQKDYFFSRPCLSTFFIKRKKNVLQEGSTAERSRPDTNTKDYYTVIVARPVSLPRVATANSNCLYPAWYQDIISSTTLDNTSSIVWTRRSKVLLFLSFQQKDYLRPWSLNNFYILK